MSLPVYDLQGQGICLNELLRLLDRVDRPVEIVSDVKTFGEFNVAMANARKRTKHSAVWRILPSDGRFNLTILGVCELRNFKPEFDTETPAVRLYEAP